MEMSLEDCLASVKQDLDQIQSTLQIICGQRYDTCPNPADLLKTVERIARAIPALEQEIRDVSHAKYVATKALTFGVESRTAVMRCASAAGIATTPAHPELADSVQLLDKLHTKATSVSSAASATPAKSSSPASYQTIAALPPQPTATTPVETRAPPTTQFPSLAALRRPAPAAVVAAMPPRAHFADDLDISNLGTASTAPSQKMMKPGRYSMAPSSFGEAARAKAKPAKPTFAPLVKSEFDAVPDHVKSHAKFDDVAAIYDLIMEQYKRTGMALVGHLSRLNAKVASKSGERALEILKAMHLVQVRPSGADREIQPFGSNTKY